jgi:hypothetical protein
MAHERLPSSNEADIDAAESPVYHQFSERFSLSGGAKEKILESDPLYKKVLYHQYFKVRTLFVLQHVAAPAASALSALSAVSLTLTFPLYTPLNTAYAFLGRMDAHRDYLL